MHHFGEAKTKRRRTTKAEACRGSKLRGDEIRSTTVAFNVVLTGDRGAVRWRKLKNKIFSEHARGDGPSVGSFEMAFYKWNCRKRTAPHNWSDSPNWALNDSESESIIHSRTYFNTYERYRFFVQLRSRRIAWAIRSLITLWPVWASSAFWLLLHLCNQSIFSLDLDHQRYEALF